MVAVPVIEARNVTRSFERVEALRGANLTINPAEIVALVGDNGAGKSSLVRILSGSDQPTSGEILVNGGRVNLSNPDEARRSGIETIYQDLALAPDLDAAANVYLGREITRPGILGSLGVLDTPLMRRQATEAMVRLGFTLRGTSAVHTLSGGQRQSVAIARAAMWATNAILMDEPTAALGVQQSQAVLDLIRRVRDSGTAVLLISHNMPQVLSIADRIVVLRLGRTIGEFAAGEATVDDLVVAITSGNMQGRAA